MEFPGDCDLSGKERLRRQSAVPALQRERVSGGSGVSGIYGRRPGDVFLVKGNRTVTPVTLPYETADSAVIETGIGEGDMVVSRRTKKAWQMEFDSEEINPGPMEYML